MTEEQNVVLPASLFIELFLNTESEFTLDTAHGNHPEFIKLGDANIAQFLRDADKSESRIHVEPPSTAYNASRNWWIVYPIEKWRTCKARLDALKRQAAELREHTQYRDETIEELYHKILESMCMNINNPTRQAAIGMAVAIVRQRNLGAARAYGVTLDLTKLTEEVAKMELISVTWEDKFRRLWWREGEDF